MDYWCGEYQPRPADEPVTPTLPPSTPDPPLPTAMVQPGALVPPPLARARGTTIPTVLLWSALLVILGLLSFLAWSSTVHAFSTQQNGYVPANGCLINRTGGQIASATTTTLVAGATGQTISIFRLNFFNGNNANTLTFQDSAGTNIVGTSAVFNLPADTGLVLDANGQQWFNSTGIGNGLQLVTSSAGPVTWYLEYTKGAGC